MTTASETISMRAQRPWTAAAQYAPEGALDRWVAVLSMLFLFGIYLDGWAHNNIPALIDTFFTPWHGVLYGGFFLVAGTLALTFVRNVARGYAWNYALPKAYLPALFGAALFMAGGVFDFFWHDAFGFEDDVEALLSPAHLLLATGAVLMLSAPLRARWQRKDGAQQGWRDLAPALLSIFAVLSIVSFFMQYATLARPFALLLEPENRDILFMRSAQGIFNFFAPTVMLMSAILFLMRRWRLPFGVITLLIGGNYLMMFLMTLNDAMKAPFTLAAIILAAVLGDLLYVAVNPTGQRTTALRLFAFFVPFTMATLYLASLLLTKGIWWEIHMWGGVPFIVGVAGLFLSFLSHPLPMPEESEPSIA